MRVGRVPYKELPDETRAALAARVGEGEGVAVPTGNGAAFASWFWPGGEMVFVKGLPADHADAARLETEAALAPFLPASAPKVLWRQEAGGWLLVCFQGLKATVWTYLGDDGEHVGSVAAVLRKLSEVPAPEVVQLTAWDRWGQYCDPADEPLLTGDRLVHSDPAATNFMTEPGGRVWLIDWAWALRGPAWIDTALWGFRLVLDGGQTVEQAAQWCAKVTAFADAPRDGLRILTDAEARSWEDEQERGMTELDATIAAARAWAAYWTKQAGRLSQSTCADEVLPR
ncbi:aminoglycoside phosphotransferase [Streptomyces sp. G-G2]|uniref:aminoglycoside phosphotransferase n=1 Tax=Streptomyces sp. G-G2 TaxID=3046201 RepID=UPI0024BBBF32|nr:aminoglycoside phosphotransferase [Streptomyces sp. G-G2]MDJ0386329.1 aminoglycoside phosphotransferase [Streptomyces sp. G-G2]